MRGLLLILTHNWKLKSAAFALAMLLWVTVSADQPTTRWLQVPVEVQVRDPTHDVITGPEPRDVRVRFYGTWRDLWEVMMERPPLRFVITEATEGTQDLVLDPTHVLVPRGRGVTAIDIRPAVTRVGLIRVARVDVPVQLVFGDPLPPELAFADSIELQPGVIRVSGPAEAMAGVTSVATQPMEMPREAGAFQRRVAIDTSGLENLIFSAREVVVTGTIEPAAQQILRNVPVESPPSFLVVPGAVEVQLRGAASLVREGAARLRVLVPAEALPEQLPLAGADLPVRVEGVRGAVTVTVQPRTVRVLAASAPQEAGTPVAPTPVPADTVGIEEDATE